MSATNWADCPRCAHLAVIEHGSKKFAADAVYGKVSIEKFVQLQAEVAGEPLIPSETLREDYEIWYTDKGLNISYSGGCQDCGLEVTFKHIEPIIL